MQAAIAAWQASALDPDIIQSVCNAEYIEIADISRNRYYDHHRLHSALDYQTPAAYAADCVPPASDAPQPPEHSRNT